MKTKKQLVRVPEMAAILGINPETLRRWHRAKRVPGSQVLGGIILFCVADVLAAVKKNGRKGK